MEISEMLASSSIVRPVSIIAFSFIVWSDQPYFYCGVVPGMDFFSSLGLLHFIIVSLKRSLRLLSRTLTNERYFMILPYPNLLSWIAQCRLWEICISIWNSYAISSRTESSFSFCSGRLHTQSSRTLPVWRVPLTKWLRDGQSQDHLRLRPSCQV